MKPADKTLREIKESMRRDTVILGDLQRHIIRQVNANNDARRTDVLHPSQICKANWCPRQSYYEMTGVEGEPRSISASLANVFEEGHAIHDKYQRRFQEMGVIYGDTYADGDYKEISIHHKALGIQGSLDGILDHTEYMMEYKSIGVGTLRVEAPGLYYALENGEMTLEEVWRSINRPFGTHLRQAFLYIWLLRNGDLGGRDINNPWLRDIDKCVFIYEFKPNQQVKELVVTYTPDMIQPILEQAREVVLSVKHGMILDRPRWAEPEAKDCKACSYRKVCYDTDDSAAPSITVRRATRRARSKALG